MFDLAARISAFDLLGKFLAQYRDESDDEELQKLNRYFLADYRRIIQEAGLHNNWFTRENVEHALQQWSEALQAENLLRWTGRYPSDHFDNDGSRTIAVIMAGNIPLVGFHDMLCVLLSGHKILMKPSSDDAKLIPFIAQLLVAIEKDFAPYIRFTEGKMSGFDAVIATGSNNSSRYFEYYFGKYPHIIRKNRSSVAVLRGDESEADLAGMAEDVFRYFGLGCRNVSKFYLPREFDRDRLFQAFYPYKQVVDNKRYGNNYDYNRALMLMDKIPFLENGFVILRENNALHAPAAVIHYEYYDDEEALARTLAQQEEELQCVVGVAGNSLSQVAPGQTQKPALWDYADRVDTIKFLRTV